MPKLGKLERIDLVEQIESLQHNLELDLLAGRIAEQDFENEIGSQITRLRALAVGELGSTKPSLRGLSRATVPDPVAAKRRKDQRTQPAGRDPRTTPKFSPRHIQMVIEGTARLDLDCAAYFIAALQRFGLIDAAEAERTFFRLVNLRLLAQRTHWTAVYRRATAEVAGQMTRIDYGAEPSTGTAGTGRYEYHECHYVSVPSRHGEPERTLVLVLFFDPAGSPLAGYARGNGVLDAVRLATERALDRQLALSEVAPGGPYDGSAAESVTGVRLDSAGGPYDGEGKDTDSVCAMFRAILSALNLELGATAPGG